MSQDPYDILGVIRNLTRKKIRSAFRKLANKLRFSSGPAYTSASDFERDAHRVVRIWPFAGYEGLVPLSARGWAPELS
jgi:hypothetical protein